MKKIISYLLPVVICLALIILVELLLELIQPDMPYDALTFDPVCGYTLAPGKNVRAQSSVMSPPECRTDRLQHTITINDDGERAVPGTQTGQPQTLMVRRWFIFVRFLKEICSI